MCYNTQILLTVSHKTDDEIEQARSQTLRDDPA